MPTDIRKSLFPNTSVRAERAGETADREERRRRRSVLICRGRAIKDGKVRKAKWARTNVELVREAKRRYRERNHSAIASYWKSWYRTNRFYLAAYKRVRRRLLKLKPPIDVIQLRIRSGRIAKRLARKSIQDTKSRHCSP